MVNTTPAFAIKTEVFEGPLELLLDLIEKRKLLVNDIALAQVTDDFIAYVAKMQHNKLAETSQFVLVASTLLLIKSKSLLPVLELTEEEAHNIEELERRLKLYQLFKREGDRLKAEFGKRPLFERQYVANHAPLFHPDKYATQEMLFTAIHDLIRRLPRKIFKPSVAVRKVISLEEMIERLKERITKQFKLSFKNFSSSAERVNVIVSFLAVLELVKQGTILAEQQSRFDDIELHRGDVNTPRYG